MRKETIAKKECFIYGNENPKFILIQPWGDEDRKGIQKEVELISKGNDAALIVFPIENWNHELSPWTAPPAFGREPFGNGAGATLTFLTEGLVPYIRKQISGSAKLILGGYSLAGLFCLWSAYQTDLFNAVAAVSPSVWFDGWIDFARDHEMKAAYIYLSLGDREHKTKNERMKTVADCIRTQSELLKEKRVETVLEWNEGNHFKDVDVRTARGFCRILERLRNSGAADPSAYIYGI